MAVSLEEAGFADAVSRFRCRTLGGAARSGARQIVFAFLDESVAVAASIIAWGWWVRMPRGGGQHGGPSSSVGWRWQHVRWFQPEPPAPRPPPPGPRY